MLQKQKDIEVFKLHYKKLYNGSRYVCMYVLFDCILKLSCLCKEGQLHACMHTCPQHYTSSYHMDR